MQIKKSTSPTPTTIEPTHKHAAVNTAHHFPGLLPMKSISVYSMTLKCSRSFLVFKFWLVRHRKTRRFWSSNFAHWVKLLASRETVQ